MAGVVFIAAQAPWGPVQILTAASLAEMMARLGQPPAHWQSVEGDAEQIAAAARSALGAPDGGWIAARVDRAQAALLRAVSTVPAVVIPPKPENAACKAPSKPVGPFRGQYAQAREAKPLSSVAPTGSHVDVRSIRAGLKMTQDGFAAAFGIPAGTIRDWEQRRAEPDAPGRILLRVIARHPDIVRQALSEGRAP